MKCGNCESETFQCSACGSLVEPWESAVPQPENREALERVIGDTFDEIERELGDEGPPMETLIGQLADAVLAVLAGEQEQVGP